MNVKRKRLLHGMTMVLGTVSNLCSSTSEPFCGHCSRSCDTFKQDLSVI